MFYRKWEPIYKKILKDFNFNAKNDIKAAVVLNTILKEKNCYKTQDLKKLIKNKEVIVFGAGPSLEKSIETHKKIFTNKIKISADGTTTALLKNSIIPDIIVTDLDGNVNDQINANAKGSIAIIHAHGDNIPQIKKYVQKFTGSIIGSTQTDPSSLTNIHNFGGFTDGDRAVFLAEHFNAKKIYLIGFDFEGKIGKYSFAENKNKKQKIKKLTWCKQLIELLKKDNSNIHFL